jgi:TolB protein
MRTLGRFLLGAACLLSVACSAPSAAFSSVQIFPFSPNPPGKLLFVKDGNLWLWKDGQSRQLTSGNTWQQPAWSPDGNEIAYVYRSTNWSDIFVMSADGGSTRRLTNSQSARLEGNDWNFRPTWSPDGSRIAFISDARTATFSVSTMDPDGKGLAPLRAAALSAEGADAMSWSQDGKTLAVAAFTTSFDLDATPSRIVLVDLAKGTSTVAAEAPRGVFDPSLSPDGTAIAFAQREAGRTEIHIRQWSQDGDIQVTKTGFARAPAWSPDGKWLAFLSAQNGSFEVYVVEVDLNRRSVSGERQITRDLNLDGTSGISWAK